MASSGAYLGHPNGAWWPQAARWGCKGWCEQEISHPGAAVNDFRCGVGLSLGGMACSCAGKALVLPNAAWLEKGLLTVIAKPLDPQELRTETVTD